MSPKALSTSIGRLDRICNPFSLSRLPLAIFFQFIQPPIAVCIFFCPRQALSLLHTFHGADYQNSFRTHTHGSDSRTLCRFSASSHVGSSSTSHIRKCIRLVPLHNTNSEPLLRPFATSSIFPCGTYCISHNARLFLLPNIHNSPRCLIRHLPLCYLAVCLDALSTVPNAASYSLYRPVFDGR